MSKSKTVYCGKRELKRLGFIVGCYPMGKGQGLLPVRDRDKILSRTSLAGWKVEPLAGVWHDRNFDADICVVYMEAK